MSEKKQDKLIISPLIDGQWAVIINSDGGRDGEFTIARFPSEPEAEAWASASEQEPRPYEVVREEAFDNFWQDIEDLAYFLDSESAANRRERIEYFLAHVSRPVLDESFEAFRRYAVLHLLAVWVAGPMEEETRKHLARQIAHGMGLKTVDEILDEIKGSDSTH